MRFDVEELFETASMTLHQNLDIRTTTLGVNLKDCIDSDFAAFQDKVYRRVNGYARALMSTRGRWRSSTASPSSTSAFRSRRSA